MSEWKVIEAVKSGDTRALQSLLAAGTDVNEQDEQGWTPLNWAAGRGDAEALQLLLEQGADVALSGRDGRTSLMIAEAAGHREAAALLTAAEKTRGLWVDPRQSRPYCKAYYLRDLRRFPEWPENHIDGKEPGSANGGGADQGLPPGDAVVYLHQDLTVTSSMWHGEGVVFQNVTPGWRAFCERELGFMDGAE